MVPNTPTAATASQYTPGMYRRRVSCHVNARAKNANPRRTATTGSRARIEKSDTASPSAVETALAIQNSGDESGTRVDSADREFELMRASFAHPL
jgi:hypothetical protein